jgi:hypothetical protein
MNPFINFIKITKITTITIITIITTVTIITTITIKAIPTGLTAILKPVYTGLVFQTFDFVFFPKYHILAFWISK